MNIASKTDEPLIRLSSVSKIYRDGQVQALADVSLEIHAGQFVSIMGPSGCGKSTLLNLLGAIDRPTSGTIEYRGVLLDRYPSLDSLRSTEIGFVFQSFYLLPNLTALENVQIPMFESRRAPRERVCKAKRLLELVGLKNRMDHLPNQLSIGQRQRVAIARALANGPSIFLADEPTGSLDSTSGGEIMDLLGELNTLHKTTLVIVTHDSTVAARAGRVIRMRDGRIVEGT